jgi:small-conductance mechanosensitive channel/CRP-like cAMP-binding protein
VHPVNFHLIAGTAALVAAVAVSSFTTNRLVRRKLRLSIFLFGIYVFAHAVFTLRPDIAPAPNVDLYSFERLAFAAGLINLLVISLINPLRIDRVPDRFPAIVQDAFVIVLLMIVATFAFGDKFLATSAVSAVVLGFALQDTFGNAIAGLAIQSEKPFNIGHWVKVGEFEGRVAEVTWRATRLRTKSGNFIVLPNNLVGKEPIINYSEPVAPTRISVRVGCSYDAPPNRVKSVIQEALANCPLALKVPAPQIVLAAFDASSINYDVMFWIEDFETDDAAYDQVRTAIYYAFRRRGIEIPYPMQVEMSKELPVPDVEGQTAERERLIGSVDLLRTLTTDQRRLVAASTRTVEYADGEAMVRQGESGDSMYIVCSGRASVMIDGRSQPIATIEPGGYFGEMSMLTGDPRTASVIAKGDVVALEIGAGVFRQLGELSPHAIERVAIAAATRRAELEGARASIQAAAVVEAPNNLLARVRRFLLHGFST